MAWEKALACLHSDPLFYLDLYYVVIYNSLFHMNYLGYLSLLFLQNQDFLELGCFESVSKAVEARVPSHIVW